VSAFVLDTSVAVAWYLPEGIAEEARQWRDRMLGGSDRFFVPLLHYWELANVLRTYVRRGELDRSLADAVFALHLEAPLEIAEPARDQVLARALAIGATAYDAVFVELAFALDVPLLTAERPSRAWVASLGSRAVVVGSRDAPSSAP
jgi:predicted nucleic acid-binding protein